MRRRRPADCYGVVPAMAHSFDRETPKGIDTICGGFRRKFPVVIVTSSMASPLGSRSAILQSTQTLAPVSP